MSISSIPPNLPIRPSIGVDLSTEPADLAILRTGGLDPADLYSSAIDPAEFGGRDSDQSILTQLAIITSDHNRDVTQSRLLSQLEILQKLKKSPDPKDQIEAAKEFGRLASFKSADARNLGLTGLISMCYASKNAEALDLLSGLLVGQMDPHQFASEAEFSFYLQSIINSLIVKTDLLTFSTMQQLLKWMDRPEIQKFNHLKPLFEQLTEKITLQIQSKDLLTQTRPTGPPTTISELVAAETVKNLPILPIETPNTIKRPNIDALLVLLRDIRTSLIFSLWPSLLKSPGLVYLVLALEDVENQVTRQRRKTRRKSAALVTHPSATLPSDLLDQHPVFVIQYDPENYIRIFHDTFAALNDVGFNAVFALLPHSDFWHSYHHARHSQIQPRANVKVIDSKLYGLGLGILVREVAHRMSKLTRRDEIEAVINKIAPHIHYWIVPAHTKTVNSHFWYQKMKRQSNWRTSITGKQLPIIGFGEQAGIVGVGESFTQSLVKVEGMVTDTYQRANSVPRFVMIEHHNMTPIASSIADYFKRVFKTSKVVIQPTSSFLANEIGDFIGIACI